jgi:cell division protease FtsH
MVFHDPTTGAGNDIEKATAVARAMVTQFGMTERLGAIKLGESNSEPFLGRDLGHSRNYSEEVAGIVDEETKKLLAHAHQEAFDILEENRDVLDAMVLELLDKETLDKAQVAKIFEPLRRRGPRPAWTGSPTRKPSDMPPVEIPEEIRARAAAANVQVLNGYGRGSTNGVAPGSNGAGPGDHAPEDDDGPGAILTPPGSGGDVHGDPGVEVPGGRDAPQPPYPGNDAPT